VIYTGEPFEHVFADQCAFLQRVVPAQRAAAQASQAP
jgi:hypothetical protein